MSTSPPSTPSPGNAQRVGPALEYLATRIGKELAPDLRSAGLDPAEVHDTVKTLLAEVMTRCYHLLGKTETRKAMISYNASDIRLHWAGPPWECSLQLYELIRPLIFVREGQAHPDFTALLRSRPRLDRPLLAGCPNWSESLERSIRHLGAVVQLMEDCGMPMLDAYRVILEREASATNLVFTYRMIHGERQLPIRREVRPGVIALA